ncbi:hypothetical protein POM88_048611 [Heracleum sosnowskyi]|uniref:ABC transmembrane type-1 domain-containing protein n=1 Tax=Heracleum sosnowskyi TaxID=360622 RepID=A0AAD8GU51_9APIA|nr:hypothetical protein POM88_048611 [Heracleum sosnowskyi]
MIGRLKPFETVISRILTWENIQDLMTAGWMLWLHKKHLCSLWIFLIPQKLFMQFLRSPLSMCTWLWGLVLQHFHVACWNITGERQDAHIRNLYLKAILRQDVAFFDIGTRTGEVVERLSADTVIIQGVLTEKVHLSL